MWFWNVFPLSFDPGLRFRLLCLQGLHSGGGASRNLKTGIGGIPLLAHGAGGVSERRSRATSGRLLFLRVLLEICLLCGGCDFYGGELHELKEC
jgi:hypothetical protein